MGQALATAPCRPAPMAGLKLAETLLPVAASDSSLVVAGL